METVEPAELTHGFFAGLDADIIALLAGCARHCNFEPETYLFKEGEAAREFFLLRTGAAALEIHEGGRPTLMLGTTHQGDIVGVSWLIPPYVWNSDARTRTKVRAIGFDAVRLRAACEQEPRIGFALMKRFAPLLVRRLQAAQLQLLDLYGRPEPV